MTSRFFFFFFQAEDGIRDYKVTGVQTCALPIYRSDDGGAKWRLLENPMKGSVVWSMAIDPGDPAVMFAGTGTPSTPGIFRSTDAGKSWTRLRVEIADDCPNVGVPRPTGIAVDPTNDRNVWVGLEVD